MNRTERILILNINRANVIAKAKKKAVTQKKGKAKARQSKKK